MELGERIELLRKTVSGIMLALLLISMSTLAFDIQASVNTPTPALAELTNSVVLEFNFPSPVVTEGLSYDSVAMPGLSQYGAPGEPILPFKLVKALIPQGKDVQSVGVTTSNRKVLEGSFNVEYGKTPVPISSNITVVDKPNQIIYNSANPYPGMLFLQMSEQCLRGYKILLLKIHPVQYIPKTNELFYFETMTVTIRLTETGKISPLFRKLPQDRALVLGVVDNPDGAETYTKAVTSMRQLSIVDLSHSYDYVVITNNALQSSFQPLVDWKIQKGLNATVVLVEDIMNDPDYHCDGLFGDGLGSPKFNDTQAHIRNFIKDAYQNWGTQYVLLGGDDEIIPSRGVYVYADSYTDYNIPCDMYYGALDGSWDNDNDTIFGEAVEYWSGPENGTAGEEADFFAEVYIGRATVNNAMEVTTFVRKTLTYEQACLQTEIPKTPYASTVARMDLGFSDLKDFLSLGGGSKQLDPTTWYSPDGDLPTMFNGTNKASNVFSVELQYPLNPAIETSGNCVYILVDSSVYSGLTSSLGQFTADLEVSGFSVELYSGSWGTPENTRSLLQSGLSHGLVGAILVGDIPFAWYEMDSQPAPWPVHEEFPIDLYYMDLDGIWSDSDYDGLYDRHTGQTAPEIWIGRLKASGFSGDETTLLNNYFRKNHAYRTGTLSVPKRALVYIDDDWVSWAEQDNAAIKQVYSTTDLVKDEMTTNSEDYKNRLKQGYEWVHLRCHGSSGGHTFKVGSNNWDGTVSSTEYLSIDPPALFYQLFVCSGTRYIETQYLGGACIFADTYGVLALGSTKTGSMLYFNDFYGSLSTSDYVGAAFQEWFKKWGESDPKWFYGLNILGDPTLSPANYGSLDPKKALIIGEKLDSITEGGNGKDLVTEIIPQYTTTRLYDRDGTFSSTAVINKMNSGVHIVNHDGHAWYTSVMGLSNSDVDSLTNTEYFMAYSLGCYSAAFDEATSGASEAIAEHFITSNGGAFAYIGNSRYGWYCPGSTYGPGEQYDRSFFSVLRNGTRNLGKALQLSKEQAPWIDRWTYFNLNLLGDPETEIVTAIKAPTAHFQTRTDLLTPPRIGGLVNLQGTARRGTVAGATFNYFKIEFGYGINPTYWMSTGINLINNGLSEVINGTLATWDTSQVTVGTYTLKLSVFDVDGLVGEDRWVVLVSTGWAKERVVYSDTNAYIYDSRTSIATDGFGNLFVANDYYNLSTGYYGIQVSKSSDGGNSWTVIKRAYDSTHNLRYPSIAIDPYSNDIFVAAEREWTSNDHDILVLRYVNGVWNWNPVANVLGNDDRFPSITSEYSYGGVNWQYISYEYVHSYNDRDLMFAKSTDHGASWSLKKLWGDFPDYNVYAQTSITNAEGDIYIAYKAGADYDSACEIRVERSSDFGSSWIRYMDIDGLPNGCSYPSIAATHGGSTVMVAFQYQWSANDIDVWYSYSTDKGTTWTKGNPLFISGLENETLPALAVDGGGKTENNIMGYFHAVCQSDHYIGYKRAYYANLPIWSQLQIVNERWMYCGLAIITQFRNGSGQFYPCVTWIDNRPQDYGYGYTLYYSTSGAGINFYSDPPGRTAEIDGNAYITPVKFNWIAGYNHTINAPSPQYVGSDIRFVWTDWSDSGTQTHSITAGTSDITLSAYFKTQYYLTINDDCSSVSQTVSVESPHPYSNNYNNTWTLTRSGALRMRCHFAYVHTEFRFDYVHIVDGAANIYSNYTGDFDDVWSVWVPGDTIEIRLTSDFSVVDDGFVIDRLEWQNQSATATIDGVSYELPESFWWDNGSSHSINAPLTINDPALPRKRYFFTEWSGLSSSISNNITFTVSTPGILTANYKTQYHLTMNTDPDGLTPQPIVTPLGPWYGNGTLVICTAQAESGYTFDHWTVDETTQGQGVNPIAISMNEPHTAIAHYLAHNIAVTNVTPSKTVTGQSYSLSIYVTVENQGDTIETFNVTIYANTTSIATQIVTLTSENSTTTTFTWNSTGFAYGNYTIWAYAWPLRNETDISDNNCTGGWIIVTIPGDVVEPYFEVDIYDITAICICYDSKIGPPPDPLYYPNCDLDGNGIIDIYDVTAACITYGQKYP